MRLATLALLPAIVAGVLLTACDDGAADADPDPTADGGPADARVDGGGGRALPHRLARRPGRRLQSARPRPLR